MPNQLHRRGGLACIERKVPILVEKPIADSVAEALELIEAADEAGVPVLIGHHRRHNPIMRKAAAAIATAARAGDRGRGLWLSHKPDDYFDVAWRREAGGGPVLINAIHDIDCLRMLCGDDRERPGRDRRAARATSRSRTRRPRCCASRAARSARCRSRMRSRRPGPGSGARARTRSSRTNRRTAIRHRHERLAHGAVAAARWHEPGQGWDDPLTRRRIPVTPGRPLRGADAQLRRRDPRQASRS